MLIGRVEGKVRKRGRLLYSRVGDGLDIVVESSALEEYHCWITTGTVHTYVYRHPVPRGVNRQRPTQGPTLILPAFCQWPREERRPHRRANAMHESIIHLGLSGRILHRTAHVILPRYKESRLHPAGAFKAASRPLGAEYASKLQNLSTLRAASCTDTGYVGPCSVPFISTLSCSQALTTRM